MKRKYIIKHRANNNEFSQHTGIESVNVENDLGCVVTRQKTTQKGTSITLYAYMCYIDFKGKINTGVKISQTCGILNCVQRDHLLATYTPSENDIEHISNYLKIDGKEHTAHVLKVPLSLFKEYLKTPKRLN